MFFTLFQTGLTTAPDRIQRVHTLARWTLPLSLTIRTFLRFGSHRLLFLLWAWDTLLPVTGPLPQISHFFAIAQSPFISPAISISMVAVPVNNYKSKIVNLTTYLFCLTMARYKMVFSKRPLSFWHNSPQRVQCRPDQRCLSIQPQRLFTSPQWRHNLIKKSLTVVAPAAADPPGRWPWRFREPPEFSGRYRRRVCLR